MKNKFLLFFLFAFFSKSSFSQKAFGYEIPKKIGYELLRGSWVAKESRDLKIFKSSNLSFNGLNAECYLKSTWTFETDSTGIIIVPKSKLCPEPKSFKFKYSLLESQTGFGPSYKLDASFENGHRELLYIGSWDGKNKLKMGYKQTNIDVTIVYTFKKED